MRGIRQGDMLSPYLFILCVKILSFMLHQAEEKGIISGVPIGRHGLCVNHLLFAGNSLLFCKVNLLEWSRVMGILESYEKVFGQALNKEKTSLFFNKNTPHAIQENITRIAGIQSSCSLEKYLRLPACIGRSKTRAFHFLIDKVWSWISNWKTKFLSIAWREILLKFVLQAIPTYTLCIFRASLHYKKDE